MRLPRNPPNDELRVFRPLAISLLLLVLACIAGYLVTHADAPQPYSLYLPVVVKPGCGAQSWKGLAGFEQGAIGSAAMCDMHIGSVYQWQQVYSKPYPSAYPLPGIIDQVKSPPSQIAFVGFNGFICNSADRLSCVADMVRGAGVSYMLWGNEVDWGGSDSDGITPTLAAQRFKVFSDTILTADPQVRFIPLNRLFPCGDYKDQFIASFITQYGVDPSNVVYSWGAHVYGNVGSHGADVMANFQEGLGCAVAQSGGKPIWISEWGADSTGSQSNAYDAAFTPAMCAAIIAAGVERAFYFIGNRGVINPSVMNVDGSLSDVGKAYANC